MWGSFIIACIVGLVIIFAPGALMLRSLHFSWTNALACAAPVSAALVTVAGALCQRIGAAGAPLVAIATLALTGVVCALCFGIPVLRARRCGRSAERPEANPVRWRSIALYAAVNMALMAYLYLRCLASPESVISFGDNDYHLTVVKAMMDSGSFSTLAVSQYPTTLASGEVPLLDTGYYPAGWHAMTALVGSLANISAPMAENVSLFLFTAVAFPLGALALLQRVFPQNRSVVFWGAFAVCACVAFPLRPLLVHQIYPTVAGFACMLAAVSLFFAGVKRQLPKGARWRFALAFALAYIGLAVLHPGAFLAATVFLFVIMLFIVIVPAARSIAMKRGGGARGNALIGLFAVAWALLGIVAWLVLLDSAALYSTTHFLWEWTVPAWKALTLVIDLGLCLGAPQYVLAVLLWCGFGLCFKHREYLWLAVSALLFCLIFFANAAGDPTVKRLFAGFWYTDPERTAALVAVAIVPLTAIGLSLAAHLVAWLLGKAVPSWRDAAAMPKAQIGIAGAIVLALFLPLNYLAHLVPLPLPGLDGASGFSVTRYALRLESDPETVLIYDADEHAFVDDVKELLDDEDELLINMPYDGSLYAYPVDDLNVYYKSHLERSQETEASATIREKLDEIATDDAVRDAVQQTGARYVLKLHQNLASNFDRNQWKPEEWTGFDDVDDETPGFETVLAKNDMRLYRIIALD